MPASKVVVKVENVSKTFDIRRYQTSLRTNALSMFRQFIGQQSTDESQEAFQALKNISFTINEGEGLAIVGRNGAGKTTLLRLLSGISEPTEGTIDVYGKFVSLLGFGAGFDQERTGRENIYLNAALYAMNAEQTEAIIDDIIEFAELDDFIDSPIKLYSSGMHARLGFSVAVHILPRIFFLDEVLAVGDFAFRRKCLERIYELKQQGVTVIFVSHSAALSKWMCERGIWLHNGEIRLDSDINTVIDAYEQHQIQHAGPHPSIKKLLNEDTETLA